MIVYDIPGRSIVRVGDDTLARMAADHANVSGIKDATCDVARPPKLVMLFGNGFSQMSGDDATMLPYLAAGGHGAISVTSNIAPRQVADMHDAWRAGDIASAQELNQRMMPVYDAMSCEASPGPVKICS